MSHAMKSLLFLSQRIPYPPNKGDKLRSFAVLRHLAASWRIHLGCFIDDPTDWQYVEAVRPYCADVFCVGLDKRWAKFRSLQGLVGGTALSQPYFCDRALHRWSDRVLREVRPDAAFLYSSVMGQYLPRSAALRPGRVVMDFVDVDSDKWRQYSTAQTWPMNWIYARESRRLLEFDRAVAARSDASIFVSQAEAALFCRLAPEIADRVHSISNGIDHGDFKADPQQPNPMPPDSPAIVFTGAMDYWPNVDAVIWFVEAMLPAIRARIPNAAFFVVGGNPTPAVMKLAERPGVTVTGRVPDVRPYLTHAGVVVAPLRVARGIQNKVLEGMAMGKVVITTSQGLEGLDSIPGRHLLLADGADAMIEATLQVLTNPSLAVLGKAAREHIVTSYSWDDKLAAYQRLLETA